MIARLVGGIALAVHLGFLTAALPAAAATVTIEVPDLSTLASTSTDLPDGASWLVAPDLVSGSVDGAYLSPFEGQPGAESIDYWDVAGTMAATSATLLLDTAASSLSFLWGSPDAYQGITLTWRNPFGDWEHLVFGWDDLGAYATGEGAMMFTITGFTFDKVEFYSGAPGFEFSNITLAPVPLPAAGLLLLAGLGTLGALRRRKTALIAA